LAARRAFSRVLGEIVPVPLSALETVDRASPQAWAMSLSVTGLAPTESLVFSGFATSLKLDTKKFGFFYSKMALRGIFPVSLMFKSTRWISTGNWQIENTPDSRILFKGDRQVH